MSYPIDEHQAALLFSFFDVPVDFIQIVPKAGRVGVADSADFVDDGVIHVFGSNNSSGVQMIGGV